MEEEEQYLTEAHYLTCSKGARPKRMKVTSQDYVYFSGDKAATEADTMKGNTFICLGNTAFKVGAAAGVAALLVPGPGWVVAAIIAAAMLAAAAWGYLKCKSASNSRYWENPSDRFSINGKATLVLSSKMICPVEEGEIVASETMWGAMGKSLLSNLGHIGEFAFGFLAGKGGAGMVRGAVGATAGLGQASMAFGKEFGRQFLNTAKKELIEQFTFKGIKNASWFCRTMRGLGIGGSYYDQYSIWSSDKSLVDKAKESAVGLILSIFAAKGATEVCFSAGTKVHTSLGLRNIEEVETGELVLTYNEETRCNEYKTVEVKHERYTQQMLTLELPTGEFVNVTPEHRFYCNDQWVTASELRAGDLLHLMDGNYTTIISIVTFPYYEKVYNFDIADNENYYVTEDGILVHNGYKKDNLIAGTPEHKADRWNRYQNRENAGWDYERWSKQYDTNIKNNKYGLGREADYRNKFGGTSKTVKTDFTNRQIDIYKDTEYYYGQLKTGKVSYGKQAKIDIEKDAWLVGQGNTVEYILEKGASKNFIDALKTANINYKIGSQL